MKLKGKIYDRPLLWSDQLCCMMQKPGLQQTDTKVRLNVNEMMMLRCMCGVTRRPIIWK